MAEITTTQSFADGDTVTAAKLNNIIANASVGADLITNRSELLTIEGTADLVLVYDDSASGLRKVKANNLVQDGSISSSKIADGSVTNAKLSALSPSPEGTYGGATSIPTIIVDSRGRVTSASNSAAVAGAVGGGTDKLFWENDQTMTTNYTLSANKNALTAGPISINNGITLTIPTGATYTVV
jgi:hypothetical protein